ncbi:MAG: putative quinol monooxygenase [Pirellulaceae bacterium]
MIHVIATVELHAGKKEPFLEALRSNLGPVRAEDGCLEYGPTVDVVTGIGAQLPVRDNVVTIVERWRDLAALRAHLAAPHMVSYRERVKDLVAKVTLQVLEPV